jgi:DNA repair protein RecO (recombination protein O)
MARHTHRTKIANILSTDPSLHHGTFPSGARLSTLRMAWYPLATIQACRAGIEERSVSLEISEAIILRTQNYSETSCIAAALTRQRGVISLIAKGAHRRNKQWASSLDTLNRVEISYYWKEGRELQIVSEISLLDDYRLIKGDVQKFLYALLPVEIILRGTERETAVPELYTTFVDLLNDMKTSIADSTTHATWQALQVMSLLGYEPHLGTCVHCGTPITAQCGFAYGEGVTCLACHHDTEITKDEHDMLSLLTETTEHCPNVTVTPHLFRCIGRFAEHHLDTALRSLRTLLDMTKHLPKETSCSPKQVSPLSRNDDMTKSSESL